MQMVNPMFAMSGDGTPGSEEAENDDIDDIYGGEVSGTPDPAEATVEKVLAFLSVFDSHATHTCCTLCAAG